MSGLGKYVDRLVVGVGYETDSASIGRVMREFNGAFTSLTGYAAAITAAAGAGAAFAISQASAMDEVGDLSAQLRTTTADLTAMQWAALKSGVGMQQLEGSLLRLDMALGEASSGTGPAAEAFAALGIRVKNADGTLKSSVGTLTEIAAGLRGVEDEGRRAQILTDLFGRSAARLRPLLDSGAEGIAALTDEARRLGLVLSEESAEAAGRLMDELDASRGIIRGMGWAIADELIPPLTDVVADFNAWLLAADGLPRTGLDRFIRGLSWTLEKLETPTGKAVAGVTLLAGALGAARGIGLAATAAKAIPGVGGLVGSMGSALRVAGPLGLVVLAVALAIDDLKVTAEGGDSVLRRLADSLGVGEEASEAAAAGAGMLGAAWDAAVAAGGLLGKEVGETVSPAIKALTEQLKEMLGVDLDGWMEGLTKRFGSAAGGFSLLSRYLSGDQSVQLSASGMESAFGREFAIMAGREQDLRGYYEGLQGTSGSLQDRLGSAYVDPASRIGMEMGPLVRDPMYYVGSPEPPIEITGVTINVRAGRDPEETAEYVSREMKKQVYVFLDQAESRK